MRITSSFVVLYISKSRNDDPVKISFECSTHSSLSSPSLSFSPSSFFFLPFFFLSPFSSIIPKFSLRSIWSQISKAKNVGMKSHGEERRKDERREESGRIRMEKTMRMEREVKCNDSSHRVDEWVKTRGRTTRMKMESKMMSFPFALSLWFSFSIPLFLSFLLNLFLLILDSSSESHHHVYIMDTNDVAL